MAGYRGVMSLRGTTASGEWWDTSRVVSCFRPGSRDWTWEDERDDLLYNDFGRLAHIAQSLLSEGQWDPITIGSDGRVWDGHHRIVVAMVLGIPELLVDLPDNCVGAYHTTPHKGCVLG